LVTSWYNNYTAAGEYFAGLSALLGDLFIECGVDHVSRCVSNNSTKNFQYLFTHASSSWEFTYLNATHAAEVAYVFGNSIFNTTMNPQEIELSNNIINYFHNFHLTGNPNGKNVPSVWPFFDETDNSVITFQVGNTYNVVMDPASKLCVNWTTIFS